MKTILLDMDGVLLDSEMVRLAYIRRFLKQQGIEVQAEALLDLSGATATPPGGWRGALSCLSLRPPAKGRWRGLAGGSIWRRRACALSPAWSTSSVP